MRLRLRKRHAVMAMAPAVLIISAIPAGVATAASQSRASAGGPSHQYIVILHNQNTRLGARSAARRAAVAAEQKPVISQLQAAGGHELASTTLVNAMVVNATAGQAQALAGNSAVAEVIPNQVIPGPRMPAAQRLTAGTNAVRPNAFSTALCGTSTTPQLNPEALTAVKATTPNVNADGAGVTVAAIADGVDTTNTDFQRNALYGTAGSPVVTQVDFSGDAASVPTAGGEMFLDTSSIAAQGNNTYDLSKYVAPGNPNKPPANCDIKIVGDAPGASVLALKVFSQNNDTTTSNFLQAINYAVSNVSHPAKVINESFGSNNVPDLAADVIRQADDAAVSAGVTVVVSSGDAGITSTIGSPATDPNVISVGATTTFRAYEQDTFGGVNVSGNNGKFLDNNISSLSSGGFSESGGTVDLVAPGDLNWLLCSTNMTMYTNCTNDAGAGSPIQFTGGTSESAPLVAGAAADVIQAYAGAHGNANPTPAQVKQILMSSATDINAPASQQGAGLLNVAAAIGLAKTINQTTPKSTGPIAVSPNQINIQQAPGATSPGQTISVTNTSNLPVTVTLSTRALTKQVANLTGHFCMQPGTPTTSCPAVTGTFKDEFGATQVFKKVTFAVPTTTHPSRLSFSADYRLFSTETDPMSVALLEPGGTYAGFSLPNGFSGFANVQVANPPAGTWTAVLYTAKNVGTTVLGAKGTVQWDANVSQFAAAGKLSATSLTLAAGATGSATLSVTSPSSAGDTEQAVVVSSGSTHTTIPVTVRTTVPTTLATGGTFSGVLTGGNGRGGAPAQGNYYTFNVPPGAQNIHAEINLATDPGDILTAYLIDPNGQNLGYSTNVTEDSKGNAISTKSVDLYHASPAAGTWTIALQWLNQVTGLELTEPFSGTIGFGALPITNNLPTGATLTAGAHSFSVTVKNSGKAPEAYFVDPRLASTTSLALPNQNVPSSGNTGVDASNMTLPLAAVTASGGPAFPYYLVPTETSQISASLSASAPVNFDVSYTLNNFGDPDLEGAPSGTSPSVTFSAPEITPGLWQINPSEIGPYNTTTGAPTVTGVSASFSAVTKAFDPAVSSSTGDLWQTLESTSTTPPTTTVVYVPAGATATITVTITAPSTPGTHSGTLYVDDLTIAGFFVGFDLPNTDEIAAIPYSYTVP